MKVRNWFRLVNGILVSILILGGFSVAESQAAQFSAELVQCTDLKKTTGQIYVSDAKYRMDLQTSVGPDVVVIVGQTADLAQVLIPMYKAYLELPSDDWMILTNDPFQAAEQMLAMYSLEEIGSETIAGYDCTKQLILSKSEYGDSNIMHRWVSEELGFPLRIELLMQEDTYAELSGIKAEPVAESMFLVPPEFEKATWEEIVARGEDDPVLAAKEEAYRTTRLVKIKRSVRMSSLHEMRVLIREGVEVRVKSESAFDKPFGLYVMPYQNGTALQDIAACSYDEPVSFTLAEDLSPNLIVLGTGEGKEASLKLTFVGQQPVVLATLEEYFSTGGRNWTINDPFEKISIRFTADLEDETEGGVVGGNFNVSTGGWAERETQSFELELADGQARSLEYSKADEITELDFMIETGRVRVQYIVDNREGSPEAPPFPGKP